MDLQTAVAASLLPTTRAAVAAAFKDLHQDGASGPQFLELLWAASDAVGQSIFDDLHAAAAHALETGSSMGVDAIALFDPRYPALLACTFNPPPVLWTRGCVEALERKVVAIVGSRAATPYALEVAGRLGAELADRGLVVASGLARGVDSAGHRGCLAAGGITIAVQGCGPDRVYPAEHAELAAEIAKNGLILSELGPGAAPLPEHFPLRNRIISGISLATVVVEASEKSGSLITARCALEQGRDVMAVPGSVLSGRNRGSHALLKDGAKVVETADDILQGLGWTSGGAPIDSAKYLIINTLLAVMEAGETYALDDLAGLTRMDGPRLLAALTDLELRGLVVGSSGRFARRA
jgi:DNA processing protein